MDEVDVTARWFIDDDEVTAEEYRQFLTSSMGLYGNSWMEARVRTGGTDYVALTPDRVLLQLDRDTT